MCPAWATCLIVSLGCNAGRHVSVGVSQPVTAGHAAEQLAEGGPPLVARRACSSGGVTFTASFTLPDGTPLGGEMAPWTGSNAPTVHIVGHLLPEDQAGDFSGKRLRM